MAERQSKTLFVRNLPFTASNQTLIETFEEAGPIKTGFVVADKESGKCKGYGYVQFSMIEDAVKAKDTITHCQGRKVFIDFAATKKNWKNDQKKKSNISLHKNEQKSDGEEAEAVIQEPVNKKPKTKTPIQEPVNKKPKTKAPKQKPVKRCRIIIRNLPFKCQETHIRSHFEKFGAITDVTIPLKKGSQSRGFAFIQFSELHAAQKAVQKMNAQEIMGRPVAVDWAIAKDRFEASTRQEDDKVSKESEMEEDKETEVDDKSSDDDDASESEQSGEDEEDSSDHSEEEEDDEESEEEEDDDKEEEEEEKKKEKMKTARKSDVDEGRTLFIRNVPFEVEEEELEEVFEEFGDLVYVRLVMDKTTGQSRGTAFVQYVTKESAEQCLAKAQGSDTDKEGGGLVVQGRPLLVVLAMSRTQAQTQKAEAKAKEEKDNRNLFLAREGLIREGTQAAVGVSQEDMKKRMKIEMAKREKLKNMNIFVSSTRLCVHNLPSAVDDKELRKVLVKAVADPAAKITECRVMRDLTRTNQSGQAKSMGYAFVTLTTHEHALKALRTLNNSTVFGDLKRPIVEFSLENKKALEAKQRRLEKSRAQAAKEKEKETGGSKPKNIGPRAKKTKVQTDQDRIAKTMHRGAPKGMPKRFGPKVRHKKREQQQQQSNKKQKKKNQQRMKRPQQQPKPKMMKKKKKGKEVTDNVDKLISKHQGRKGRWFETS